MTANSPDSNADERLTQVETLLSHLQHDLDKLNDALLEQQSRVDALSRLVSKVEAVVEQLPESPRDPEEERPPHY